VCVCVCVCVCVGVVVDGKGFVECRSFAGHKLSSRPPRFSRSQLIDYLRTSERSAPDVVQMQSTPLRSVQTLLVAILHDYWLAKYVLHVTAASWTPAAQHHRGSSQVAVTRRCLSPGMIRDVVHSSAGTSPRGRLRWKCLPDFFRRLFPELMHIWCDIRGSGWEDRSRLGA